MATERVNRRIPSHQNGGCDSKEPGFTPHEKNEEKTTNVDTSKPNVVVAILQLFLKVSLCLMAGLVFGIAQEKGRVFDPKAIRYQMIFKKMVMLKMFLSALATGMFCMSLLAMLPFTSRTFFRVCNRFFNGLADKGISSSVLGGLILGIGLTVAGSCPTAVFVQIGAKVPNAGYTLAGAFAGTLIYSIFKPLIDRVTRPIITEATNPWVNSPYFILAMPLAVMFGMLVLSFEILMPWTRDVKGTDPTWIGDQKVADPELDIFAQKAWPPYVSGILIGFLQIPLVLGIEETLGGSSSLLTVLSLIFVGPLKRISPFIAKYRYGFESWWQIFYVTGIILGAYWSSTASGYIGTTSGVSPTHAFVGGALMLLGARIAGGCTSGHGITGMGFLSILSVITVACMFGGAITTAYVMHSFKLLKV